MRLVGEAVESESRQRGLRKSFGIVTGVTPAIFPASACPLQSEITTNHSCRTRKDSTWSFVLYIEKSHARDL
ncbi:hypothetical protein AFLA_004911 [Aspergillus flavus NRRL3357]|nr:hypothetical protein AFLA_004911 [Aspergillus flavus NRRL3357]